MDNNHPYTTNTSNDQKNETAPSVTPQKAPAANSGFSIDNKALAIIGLVLGIVLSPIIGLVLGIVALAKMKKSGDKSGKGFAVAAVSINGLIIAFSLVWGTYMLVVSIRSGTAAALAEAFGEIFLFFKDFISAFFKGLFDFYFKKGH